MPRYSEQRDFQLGDFWLSKRRRSPAWCRTWFDNATRQTRRVSLGTTDFEDAKARLTDWFVLQHTKSEQAADDASLAEIFACFYDQHGKTLASRNDVRCALNYWLDFHGEASVAEATAQIAQPRFREWLADKQLSASSVRKTLIIGKSALNWAWKRGELAQVPYIELVHVPRPAPKGRPLEIEELQLLFRLVDEEHLRTFMLFMLGTAARTSAVLELTRGQIDLKRGLIDLNPVGRKQTKKYRPVVRLPEPLREIVMELPDDPAFPIVNYKGLPVASVKTAWNRLKRKANLPGNVQTYSFRHTVARWLRMQGVPAWEVAAQLGHKVPEYSTTEIYAPFDPAYLNESAHSICNLVQLVMRHSGHGAH